MKISIFGLGYVGCVSAVCLAKAGHAVTGIDLNEEKTAMINQGRSPIIEPGLEESLKETVQSGRLKATTSIEDAVIETELALICVGTPSYPNGDMDTSALQRVATEIGDVAGRHGKRYKVVIRSTCLPGTIEDVILPALHEGMRRRFGADVRVAVNPEFIREGSAIKDFANPPFTLVGANDRETVEALRELYASVDAEFVQTDIRTAEMVKYACNAYHALKVCFANEMGDAAEAFGADPHEAMRIFRMDTKLNVSAAYLKPGFAFGGSCLPKDIRALLYAARRSDVSMRMMESVLPSNQGQIRRAVDKVLATGRRRIGIVGLSFKPDTDDLRESPMVTLVETLIGKGCSLRIFDRNVALARLMGANRRYIHEEIPHISSLMCENPQEFAAHAEVIVIGNNGEDTKKILPYVGAQHKVVDLTRGEVRWPTDEELKERYLKASGH